MTKQGWAWNYFKARYPKVDLSKFNTQVSKAYPGEILIFCSKAWWQHCHINRTSYYMFDLKVSGYAINFFMNNYKSWWLWNSQMASNYENSLKTSSWRGMKDRTCWESEFNMSTFQRSDAMLEMRRLRELQKRSNWIWFTEPVRLYYWIVRF